jgi:hypothetical protein
MGARLIDLPWDSQPQELAPVNPDHPLAPYVVGLWVGSNPNAINGQPITSSGVTQAVLPQGRAARIGAYSGTSIINLPNNDTFRLRAVNPSIVIGARSNTQSSNQYKMLWSVRDGSTQIAAFILGLDGSAYLGGRVAIAVAGNSDVVGPSGSAKQNEYAIYGTEWGVSGAGLYVNGESVAFNGAASSLIGATSIQPALGNRQTGGRALDGDIAFAWFFNINIGAYWHAELARNPWQMVAPQQIYVPIPVAGALPTLSLPRAKTGSITATGFVPQWTAS